MSVRTEADVHIFCIYCDGTPRLGDLGVPSQYIRQCKVSGMLMSSPNKNINLLLENPKSFNPYPTAFPYGNDMVLHFYQQQESSTTKTVHKVINKGLKAYV